MYHTHIEYRDGGQWTSVGDETVSFDNYNDAKAYADNSCDGDYGLGEFRATVADDDGEAVYETEWKVDPEQDKFDDATWLVKNEGEFKTEYLGVGDDGAYLHTIQNDGRRGAHSAQENDGRWSDMAAPVEEITLEKLIDAMLPHEDSLLAAMKKIADAHPTHDMEDLAREAGSEFGSRLTFQSATEEEWDEDDDGDPTCATTTTVELLLDGSVVMQGEAQGYYCHCTCGSEHFSSWQDYDDPDGDNEWNLITPMLQKSGLINDPSDLVEGPAEPAKPDQDPKGEWAVLYHGWEQDWIVVGRYATEDDAQRACRIKARETTEANSVNSYGWEHAVALIDDEGDIEASGLTLTIQEYAE